MSRAGDLIRDHITVTAEDATPLPLYVTRPAAPGHYPGVIIGMELFGVTAHIRKTADDVAALGFVAVAPDFYHRSKPNIELPYDDQGRAQGFALLHRLLREHIFADVGATLTFLQEDEALPVGFLGFSVGGHIAYLAASRFDFAACAVFYPGWLASTAIELSQPVPTLTLTEGIAPAKLMYVVGERDALITPDERASVAQALTAAGVEHEIVIYPGVQHGFFCDERETYDASAHDDAWQRVQGLFSEKLKLQDLPEKKVDHAS